MVSDDNFVSVSLCVSVSAKYRFRCSLFQHVHFHVNSACMRLRVVWFPRRSEGARAAALLGLQLDGTSAGASRGVVRRG